jgi:hypothetical protein
MQPGERSKMKKIKHVLVALIKDESGQDLIEPLWSPEP